MKGSLEVVSENFDTKHNLHYLLCLKLIPGPIVPVIIVTMIQKTESFLDARDGIDDIMKSLGDGAEWQGSNGCTTTWNVEEQSVIPLMRKIQEYNSIQGQLHIIHIQLY